MTDQDDVGGRGRLGNPGAGGYLHRHARRIVRASTDGRIRAAFVQRLPAESAKLDEIVVQMRDRYAAVTDPTFVRFIDATFTETSGKGIQLVHEFVEGAIGFAPDDPEQRPRAVRLAALGILPALGRIAREQALVHGDIKPRNLLIGALTPAGDILHARILSLGTGAVASALVAAHAASPEVMSSVVGEGFYCTETAWGTPGFAPLGRFDAGSVPTMPGDGFSCVVVMWHLLTQTELYSAPAPDIKGSRRVAHFDEQIRTLARRKDRLAYLRARLAQSFPAGNAVALNAWASFFSAYFGDHALSPDAINPERLKEILESLPDIHAAVTLKEGRDPSVRAGPIAPAFVENDEYTATVTLDFLGGGYAREQSITIQFRYKCPIGIGGMGSVHRVEVLRNDKTSLDVALKLASNFSMRDEEALRNEARVLRTRMLDGVTQFLALVTLPGGMPALLMGYQRGTSLADILDEHERKRRQGKTQLGALSADEARVLGTRLLRTVGALHEASDERTDLVHADIKPANIIVPTAQDGSFRYDAAVLIDFGVSRLRRNVALARTPNSASMAGRSSGIVGGTAGYMPVGHMDGDIRAQSDVFAIAVVLYECLTLLR